MRYYAGIELKTNGISNVVIVNNKFEVERESYGVNLDRLENILNSIELSSIKVRNNLGFGFKNMIKFDKLLGNYNCDTEKNLDFLDSYAAMSTITDAEALAVLACEEKECYREVLPRS